jgi:hypothetical protein
MSSVLALSMRPLLLVWPNVRYSNAVAQTMSAGAHIKAVILLEGWVSHQGGALWMAHKVTIGLSRTGLLVRDNLPGFTEG